MINYATKMVETAGFCKIEFQVHLKNFTDVMDYIWWTGRIHFWSLGILPNKNRFFELNIIIEWTPYLSTSSSQSQSRSHLQSLSVRTVSIETNWIETTEKLNNWPSVKRKQSSKRRSAISKIRSKIWNVKKKCVMWFALVLCYVRSQNE